MVTASAAPPRGGAKLLFSRSCRAAGSCTGTPVDIPSAAARLLLEVSTVIFSGSVCDFMPGHSSSSAVPRRAWTPLCLRLPSFNLQLTGEHEPDLGERGGGCRGPLWMLTRGADHSVRHAGRQLVYVKGCNATDDADQIPRPLRRTSRRAGCTPRRRTLVGGGGLGGS